MGLLAKVPISLIGVLVLASIHLAAGRLHRGATVRPMWLAAGSGLSIAYVFVHLLPELSEAQGEWLAARPDRALIWLDTQIYVAALLGVILSVTLDRVARSRRSSGFWLHITWFAVYNALIGGFALRVTSAVPMVLATLAFGAHFWMNDHDLYVRYGRDYTRAGRWVLAVAIVAGWGVALVVSPSPIVVLASLALLSGGMIASAIRNELPERGHGQLLPWVVGALGYTLLMLALRYSEHPPRG